MKAASITKALKKSAATADFQSASRLISRYFPVYHIIGNHEVLSMSKDNIRNLTGRKNYFAFIARGYQIIILDANYTAGENHIDAKHADDFIYNGTLPDDQLDWLENKIKGSSKNIISIHHPLHELTNRNEVEGMIKENKKRIIFIANGHKHSKVL